MSTMEPPVMDMGELPNAPAKKRVMRMVWMSFAVAVPKANAALMKYG
jgi:hypothetical protein